jgi:hypothetical protein
MIRKVCCPVMQQADIAFPNSHAANEEEKEKKTGSPDPLRYAVLCWCVVYTSTFLS